MTICNGRVEPIGNPNELIFFDDGVLCAVLGARHPLCALLDRIWYATAAALDLANPSDAPRDAGKFLWSWSRGFGNAAIEDSVANGVRVGDLCSSLPPPLPDDVTYADLVAFLAGQSDAVLAKARLFWLYRTWFEKCQCVQGQQIFPTGPIAIPSFTPPSVPYCGGFVSWPPQQAIAQSFEPLAEFVSNAYQENLEQLAAYSALATQLLADDPFQQLQGDYWEIGGILYYGQLGRGFVERVEAPPGGDCPPSFPYYLPLGPQRQSLVDPLGQLDVAVLLQPGERRRVAREEIAISTLLPLTDDLPEIPAGTVLSVEDETIYEGIAGVCWYAAVSLRLPGCPHGRAKSGAAWGTTSPGDPDADDRILCLEQPQLCRYAKPCCGGAKNVALLPREQLRFADLLGFVIPGDIREAFEL